MSLKILQNKKIQELIVFGIMPPLSWGEWEGDH